MKRQASVGLSLCSAVLAFSLTGPLQAEPEGDAELFAQAAESLQKGAFEAAIAGFEHLSDRGFVHPDASYDRALAYIQRARSPQLRPGDLGQAAAALAETIYLRPSDDEAARLLEDVRAEIATRRVREGGEPVSASPSLSRAVVALLSENAWSVLALFGSAVTTAGLALRELWRRPTVRFGGGIAAAIGLVLVLVCAGMTWAAGAYRRSSRPAVVVVQEARLLAESGLPLAVDATDHHDRVPEGERVLVLERRGALLKVEWGTTRAWVHAGQVRVLASPPR